MAEEKSRPSLEPPKLFGRRRSTRSAGEETPAQEPAAGTQPSEPAPEPSPTPEPSPAPEPTPQPEPTPAPVPTPRPEPTPTPEPTPRPVTATAPSLEEEQEAAFVDVGRDAPAPEDQPEEEPAAAGQRGGLATLTRRLRRPSGAGEAPHADADGGDGTVTAVLPATSSTRAPQPVGAAKPKKERGAREPLLTGRVASVVTGLLVGLLLVGLTFGGFAACEAVQGTSSCGTGPGITALIAIFVLAIVAGRYLLAAFRVPDPGSTSFLAVGLTAVVALLFLVDVLDTWPMLVVIPVVSAATFLLSWWVTTSFVESEV